MRTFCTPTFQLLVPFFIVRPSAFIQVNSSVICSPNTFNPLVSGICILLILNPVLDTKIRLVNPFGKSHIATWVTPQLQLAMFYDTQPFWVITPCHLLQDHQGLCFVSLAGMWGSLPPQPSPCPSLWNNSNPSETLLICSYPFKPIYLTSHSDNLSSMAYKLTRVFPVCLCIFKNFPNIPNEYFPFLIKKNSLERQK